MPILFGLVGVLLIISGWNNTYQELGAQLSDDFTGGGAGFSGSFLPWLGAVAALWMLSSVPSLEKPAKALFALVILVFLIGNDQVFSNFQSAFSGQNAAEGPQSVPIPLPQGPAPLSLSGGGGGGAGLVGNLLQAAPLAMGG